MTSEETRALENLVKAEMALAILGQIKGLTPEGATMYRHMTNYVQSLNEELRIVGDIRNDL